MLVGGIYFINHKTKDYFPEGAGILNLSVSNLNEHKRAMIRNYFWVIHITIKKIIIGNIQPARDDPATSPGDSLKVLT